MAPGGAATRLLKILSDGRVHSLFDIGFMVEFNRRQISDAAALLRRRGFMQTGDPGVYQLSEGGLLAVKNNVSITSGPIGPTGAVRTIGNIFKERAWRSMRVRRRFTLAEIVGDATLKEADPSNNLSRFIRALISIGYVELMPTRRRGTRLTSNGHKMFMLVKNTGPRAPIYSAARGAMHDVNLGKDIPCALKC